MCLSSWIGGVSFVLHHRIVELRKSKKITQEVLAGKIGVSRSALSQYELGSRQPDYEIVKRMAKYFEVSTDYLLGKDDRHPAEKLKEYLDMELTDEEIIERMNFKVDNLTLSIEEVKEFIAFVRAKRFMKSGQAASVSKDEEL